MTKKLTKLEFTTRANIVHNDRYDYHRAIYVNAQTKLLITCEVHGDFTQRPHQHLSGRGCNKCPRVYDFATFVKRANTHFGDFYIYDETEWTDASHNTIIGCPLHGNFTQNPRKHMVGQGCPDCGIRRSADAQRFSTVQFITRAMKKHGNMYDYSLVDYKGAGIPVIIICPHHGKFTQLADNHYKHGCNKCSNNKVSSVSSKWLTHVGINEEFREVKNLINGHNITVDGYDPDTNTVYEFYGDYWHGNPDVYHHACVNPTNRKTYGELYQNTIDREIIIRMAGINLISIWENDWNNRSA